MEELKKCSPQQVWNYFCDLANQKPNSLEIKMKAVFSFLYPRIDVNVSHATNHLLKAPFSVHPSTGKVCIPFSSEMVENFDLNVVPSIQATCNGDYEFVRAVRLFEAHVQMVRAEANKARSLIVKEIRNQNEMEMD